MTAARGLPELPELPGFQVVEPSQPRRTAGPADIVFSSVALANGGERIIVGKHAWRRGEPHIAIACRHPEGHPDGGREYGRIFLFPGSAALVTRAIQALRRGESGTIGRIVGAEISVQVSVSRERLTFQRFTCTRRVGSTTRLSAEEPIALDRALAWLEHEGRRTDET